MLVDAGMPDGAPHLRRGTPDPMAVRAAVAELESGDAVPTPDALLAWLRALRHHWPGRFAELAGEPGARLIETLEPASDPNRTLKLRRIAIENLARWV